MESLSEELLNLGVPNQELFNDELPIDDDFSLEKLSDNELIKIIHDDKSKQIKAFSEIISRYLGLIIKRAKFFSDDNCDVEDLTQEGLFAFYKAVDRFDLDNGAKFSSFAEVCVTNAVKSALMKYKKNSYILPEDETYSVSSPEIICLDKEYLSSMKNEAKSILGELEFSVFKLYIEGYTYSQIAKTLKISEKSVDNAAYRLKKKLRKHLYK